MVSQGFSKDLEKEMVFPEGGIYSKVLVKSSDYNHTLMCLSKNTEIDTHTSTKNGAVQVLKGKGTFTLQDQEIEMRPGIYIFMPRNAPHSLKAEEDTAILLTLHN